MVIAIEVAEDTDKAWLSYPGLCPDAYRLFNYNQYFIHFTILQLSNYHYEVWYIHIHHNARMISLGVCQYFDIKSPKIWQVYFTARQLILLALGVNLLQTVCAD